MNILRRRGRSATVSMSSDCIPCRAFPDVPITTDDYEQAASFYNLCRARGIQGSNTDFLICAIAARNDFAIFTMDEDFTRFAKVLPIALILLFTGIRNAWDSAVYISTRGGEHE